MEKAPLQNFDLQRKAEELLKQRKNKKASEETMLLSEIEILKLAHELEVHQIELEMQNEELILAKKAEDQIKESYIELYDFAPVAYFSLSKRAEILSLNLKAAQLLGKERNSLINSHFAFFIDEHEKDIFAEFFDKVMFGSENAICELSLSFNTHESVFLHLSGNLNESKDQCLITAVDVSEIKIAEETILLSKRRMEIILNTSFIGTWQWNVQTGETIFNEMWAEIIGYTLDELAPLSIKTWETLAHTEDLIQSGILLEQHFAGKLPYYDCECRIKHKNGHWVWVRDRGSVISYSSDGKPLMMFGTHSDISNQKQAEKEINEINTKLSKVNTEKDKFFSIIAHDLRGPLGNFMGLSKIMAESLKEFSFDDIENFANTLEKSASNLYRLLENLLEWSKMQQGIIPFNPKLIALKMIVFESIGMTGNAAEKKEIKISYNISAETEVFADSNILQTILRNLISNAIKFTHKGGDIEISAKPNKDHELEISVKDTGIGMSQEIMGNLFKIDTDTNRKGTDDEPSTGLGVIICKDLIEKHGGKLWIESEVGVGSCFYFTLPISN
ncbi:MAG: PAS domain-containing sensor histidine kinase [Bacteroidota bacterium]